MNSFESEIWSDAVTKEIISPESGWESQSVYLVNTSAFESNPIHQAILHVGDLQNGFPTKDAKIWHNCYGDYIPFSRCYFLRAIKKLGGFYSRELIFGWGTKPKESWTRNSVYLVDLKLPKKDTKNAILYTGFLEKGEPSSYSEVLDVEGGNIYQYDNVKNNINIIKKIYQEKR